MITRLDCKQKLILTVAHAIVSSYLDLFHHQLEGTPAIPCITAHTKGDPIKSMCLLRPFIRTEMNRSDTPPAASVIHYDNLYLVGDWTDFGANFGYMEGTVLSAMQAVAALIHKGAAANGPASKGPASEGPAAKGSASKGPASKGPASSDPASNDPASNG